MFRIFIINMSHKHYTFVYVPPIFYKNCETYQMLQIKYSIALHQPVSLHQDTFSTYYDILLLTALIRWKVFLNIFQTIDVFLGFNLYFQTKNDTCLYNNLYGSGVQYSPNNLNHWLLYFFMQCLYNMYSMENCIFICVCVMRTY